jgi:hypothetical protein
VTYELLEYLESFGFKKPSESNRDLVWRMSRKELVEFAEGAAATTKYAENKATTPYEFSASETFAGAATPCGSLTCRLERIRELAYFAALYADRVLISSPFPRLTSISSLSELRIESIVALESCLYLKPLLTAGLVEYTDPHHEGICLECCAMLSGTSADEWRQAIVEIEREFRERVKYYLEREDGQAFIVPDGAPDLFDKHAVRTLDSVPKQMRKLARKDGRWLVPADLVEELKLPQDYASEVAIDVLGRDLRAGRFGTGYLTRREIDLRIVNKLSNRLPGTLIDRNFGHDVPMLEGIAPVDLIRLRQHEADAFRTYQLALKRAAIEGASAGTMNLSEIFRDIVAPELRRMNAAVASAQGALVRGLAASVTGATAFVSLAFCSGLFAPSVATAIGALGGIHFTKEVADKLSKLIKPEPEKARENPFYFLWKVSKLRKRARAS